jgi:hypothetical protein
VHPKRRAPRPPGRGTPAGRRRSHRRGRATSGSARGDHCGAGRERARWRIRRGGVAPERGGSGLPADYEPARLLRSDAICFNSTLYVT